VAILVALWGISTSAVGWDAAREQWGGTQQARADGVGAGWERAAKVVAAGPHDGERIAANTIPAPRSRR